MKLFVFSIRDGGIQAYMPPFVVTHLGQAERSFSDALNNPESQFYKHPEDYDLYQLGTFDDGTGMFEVGVPQEISRGSAVFKARAAVQAVPASGVK